MVGQVFEDFATFKTGVKNHSIITKRPISLLKSDPMRVSVGCKNRNCRWYIYVSKSNDNRGVEIKSCYLEHDGCIMDFKNRFADYKYIARKYVHRFLIDPYLGIDSIIQTVHEDLHLQIGRDKTGRVRKHGVELVRGKSSEQYARLYDYCAKVRKSNVGSTVFVEATDAGHFKRMYCCLGASVGTENEDNCKWFLLYLTNDLDIDEESSGNWMIMSDKQKIPHRDKQMVVDLNNQTCTCRKWELSGIPCSHAISCFAFMEDRSENYVHKWYRVENYMKAYGVHISPMVGLESWQKTDRPTIKPLHVNIVGSTKKGRKQTMRRKGPEEAVERQRKQRAYTVKLLGDVSAGMLLWK
ncbi:hypothetical protein LINPERPRIM_LOCUS38133 [Linum perenne]